MSLKTPAEVVEASQSRWGAPRLADLLRKAMSGEKRSPEDIARVEADWAALEQRERDEHSARQRAEWPEHLVRCGAPPRAVEALSKQQDTLAMRAARAFMSSGKQALVLSGWTGTGKTVAACSVFGAAQRTETRTGHGLWEWDASRGLFLRFLRLLRVSDFATEDRILFERACSVRVLVLDDVGGQPGERLGARHQGLLEELVDRRDMPGRLTVYTTNLSLQRNGAEPSDFGAFVGARVVSRIGRSCKLVDCGQQDLRLGGVR